MKNILILIALCISFPLIGQNSFNSQQGSVFSTSNYSSPDALVGGPNNLIYSDRGSLVQSPQGYKGSYYFTEDFQPGNIINTKTGEVVNGFLLFDVYHGSMIMSMSSDGADEFMVKMDSDISVHFDNRYFQIKHFNLNGKSITAYVEIIETLSDNNILSVLHTKEKLRPRRNINSNADFLIIKSNGDAIKFKNNSKRILDDVEQPLILVMKEYIEINNIKFENDYKGVIAVAKYYASFTK